MCVWAVEVILICHRGICVNRRWFYCFAMSFGECNLPFRVEQQKTSINTSLRDAGMTQWIDINHFYKVQQNIVTAAYASLVQVPTGQQRRQYGRESNTKRTKFNFKVAESQTEKKNLIGAKHAWEINNQYHVIRLRARDHFAYKLINYEIVESVKKFHLRLMRLKKEICELNWCEDREKVRILKFKKYYLMRKYWFFFRFRFHHIFYRF